VVAGICLVLAVPWAADGSSPGTAPAAQNPATAVYEEDVPGAGGKATTGSGAGTSPTGNAALDVYTEQVPAAGGSSASSSTSTPRARTLEQLLTSSSLGGPQQVQPRPGDTGTSYGSFSFQTVREVAGVGTARFAVLLAALFLISVVLAATALSRLQRR
jgi:hypothetical protein